MLCNITATLHMGDVALVPRGCADSVAESHLSAVPRIATAPGQRQASTTGREDPVAFRRTVSIQGRFRLARTWSQVGLRAIPLGDVWPVTLQDAQAAQQYLKAALCR